MPIIKYAALPKVTKKQLLSPKQFIPRRSRRVAAKRKTLEAGNKQFKIKKRSVNNGRNRNLRSGQPEVVERPLPNGEKFDEYFLNDFTATLNGFTAPYREGRLPNEEVNWLSNQDTPKKGANSSQPMKRPRTSLGVQFDRAFRNISVPPSTPKKPTQ